MDDETILLEAEERMEKAVEHLAQELRGIRSGRATPGLVDHIRVEAYGTTSPLRQLAQVSIPEPRQILVKPYDPSTVKDIARAIQASDVGINPSVDGKIIRLVLPALSEERRKQLASQVREKAEGAKVSLRNVRREANKEVEAAQRSGELTEDRAHDLKEEIQKLTKAHEEKVERTLQQKVQELMEV
ncbi:MAG: ribosome recycling factor [Planctomycetota bacterium]